MVICSTEVIIHNYVLKERRSAWLTIGCSQMHRRGKSCIKGTF